MIVWRNNLPTPTVFQQPLQCTRPYYVEFAGNNYMITAVIIISVCTYNACTIYRSPLVAKGMFMCHRVARLSSSLRRQHPRKCKMRKFIFKSNSSAMGAYMYMYV